MAVTTDPVKTWETKSSTGKHFEVLDGIRGVAILMVVFYHAMYVNPDSGPIAQAVFKLFQTGRVGVPVFFVLSGFLISFPFFRQREANSRSWWVKHYARRRIGKIIPPFYLSIILFGLYYYLRFSNPAYIVAGLGWALGVSNFFPQHILFNSSYWSLLVEGQFYILLPILFLVTRGLKVRSTTVCLFLILFVIPLLFRQFTWPKHAVDKDPIIFAVTRFPGALDFFAWGVLFAGSFVPLFQTGQDFRAFSVFGYAGIVLLAATLCLYASWIGAFNIDLFPTRWSIEALHLLPSVATFLLLFFLFDPACFAARVLSYTPLRFIGIVSYEWFLFHQPVLYLFQNIFGHANGSLLKYFCRTFLPLALTFGWSVWLYRYFSLPIMNRIRGRNHAKN